MTTVSLTDAQATLADLVHRLSPGEEIVVTENNLPIARILPVEEADPNRAPILGGMKGTVLYMADDFDAPLDDFKEYME